MNPLHSRKLLQSLLLLISLLVAFLLTPLTGSEYHYGVAARLVALCAFCAGGYLLVRKKHWFVTFFVIAIPYLVFGILRETHPYPSVTVVSGVFGTLFTGQLFLAVLLFTLYRKEASKLDRIVAGICGYLLLGFLWVNLYWIADAILPNAFVTPEGIGSLPDNGSAVYFSFVTLSTLGYGDIFPATPMTRMLATLEAVSGTLFLAVFISALVSKRSE